MFYYTCGPSTRFFLVKSTGLFLIIFPLQTNQICAARKREEYVPTISPTVNAIANPVIGEAPRNKNAKTAIYVGIVVFKLLVKGCTTVLFRRRARSVIDLIRFSLRRFSLILSKVTIVSFIE